MDSLFNYFSTSNAMLAALIVLAATLAISALFAFLVSFKLRATKGFFVTTVLMPVIVAAIIAMMSIFLTGTTSDVSRIVTIAVALGLIRFRSVNAKSDELTILFATVAIGLVAGLGYIVAAAIVALLIALVYLLLMHLHVFEGRRFSSEKTLKITIPESLEYSDAFKDTFDHYTKTVEMLGVKTTGMGSLFRLTYKIILKNPAEEKEFIDELRTKNGNLEISILPYAGEEKAL